MLEAPSLREVNDNIKRAGNKLSCILLAPTFDDISNNSIVPRFGYLDQRTSSYIHFYCAGYGGYWHRSVFPDMIELGEKMYRNGTIIPWAFSQIKFAQFVDELEDHTSWRYSGGTELIILNSEADYSNALIFDIDKMVKDGVIDHPAHLLESIIRIARRKGSTIEDLSARNIIGQSGKIIFDSIIELLPKPVRTLKDIWIRGRHYFLEDIS